MSTTSWLLDVDRLEKHYPIRQGWLGAQTGTVKAVDDVSFAVRAGEVLGLVGESGCGKTTTGRCVLRLIEPTAGSIKFDGRELVGMPRRELRPLRREMQIIFQDPYSSLDPRMTVERTLLEAVTVQGQTRGAAARDRVAELLVMVGLSPDHATRYPHEFSGGQRQRIGIARALAVGPQLIVADEPVSALDVSVQAQIINLLRDLQQRLNLAMVFVAHDLAIVEHISDRVAVMFRGRIVETAASSALYGTPRHPYTVTLLSAILVPDPDRRRIRNPIANEAVHGSTAAACGFYARCPMARDRCRIDVPHLREVVPGHWSACHFAEDAPGLRASDAPVGPS